jgi:hypothetical protein
MFTNVKSYTYAKGLIMVILDAHWLILYSPK